ncbi:MULTISPECIES: class I adenylate-forming enzyme family protein [Mycobacterium avium complex (MAC)]|uniref:AMP-binding protein n=1 Tax=Mycobacterium bouchedurhonense TaxID=701041 RepID=A0AAW5S4B6_MYCBC|nr:MULTISPECIES: AMP-binding protein [Mycobacterium avium complex (MAC)]MBG0729532.1 cyclohexanecarboxylate-CoA ligase [Mycobacterium avium]MBZ4502983.1 cyclohexanecarboxylate-CoA ligase [Mycobacterium avium subsp. hominissuis]MBZ4520533.1 cyclohexanecarboxylate-CoA ligase [Mycobacterium avium subsp. hominissuis]MBZ4532347.1 cyclohexanecarboxylate-CoA ligase [Mycobacterium avium subsp. hominissuis]MBZ4536877.1 cyclohexanecarboxylate-CoA ligase [Mycobacterium avium subsp. hominissuis]
MTAGTIAGLLDECAAGRPTRPLLRDVAGETLTVSQVAELASAAAGWLADAGVRPGMTVAWQLPSHVNAALVMLALARMPVVQAPVLHLYRRREVCAAVDVANADILLVDESTAANTVPGIPTVTVPCDFVRKLQTSPVAGAGHEASHSPGDPRWVYFTSGTTGRPKAVRHTDATLLSAARGYTAHLGVGTHPREVGTIAFPIAHIGGMVYLATALLGDFPVVLIPKVSADDLPRVLAEHRVTVTGASTAFYQMLLTAQFAAPTTELLVPSLRMLIGGGAACPPEVHKQVREHLGIPIVHAYGMTEAPMICVSEATDTDEQLANSAGRPIPGSQVRIAANGEIELRGTNLTPGYLQHEQWADALTADGWFRSGDRGYLRPDGRIVVTGRIKDLIIRKGENVAPDEIENELLAHPLVDEIAVLGQPDELRGELVCAVVRRSPRHRDVTLDELCTFLDQRGLMKQKWPERLVLVDEFPLTGLGKVAKSELARQISGGTR